MADQRAPGLVAELPRLAAVGATFSGIVGDIKHTYGFHIPSSRCPASDYSMKGTANRPVGDFACAIDIGMDWPASRQWLAWLIAEIRADRIKNVAEVIGSFDGRNVRYWSDSSGWHQSGSSYGGTGHDSWSHVAIYRSTARVDHRLLAGWTATGLAPTEDDVSFADKIDIPATAGPLPAGARTGMDSAGDVLGYDSRRISDTMVLATEIKAATAALLAAAGAEVQRDAAERAARLTAEQADAARDAALQANVSAVKEVVSGLPGSDPSGQAEAIAAYLSTSLPTATVAMLAAKLAAPAA